MKGVQGDRDETDRPAVSHRDEYIPFLVRARGSHRGGLALLPVGVQAEEDVVAEGILYWAEDGFPRAQRELNDRPEVVLAELANDRLFGHSVDTVSRFHAPLDGPASLPALSGCS
jgi:hypothetical protein